jgi:hypothetical protein
MKSFIAKAALVAPVLLLTQTASATSLRRLDANTVSVQATRVPVGQLLGELDAISRLDNLFIEPAIESRVVSVSIERVSLADAATQILTQSGLDFIVWGRRIFVGDPNVAVQLARQGSTPNASAPENVESASAAAPVPDQAPGTDSLTTDEFSMVGENVTYHDPNFVTYKMRPEVVRRRLSVDVTKIP